MKKERQVEVEEPSKTMGSAGDDPFDLLRLRLSQDFSAQDFVKKLVVTVPVRKPDRQWWVRVHPSEEWRLATGLLEHKEERELYLVDRPLWGELPGEVVPQQLFTAINRQGVVFLWPVKLPGEDGKHNVWHKASLQAAQMAMTRWIRVASNMALGAYDVYVASAEISDPVWPDIGFKGLLEVAFKDKFIRDLDHPVIRKLRGEL